MKRYGMAALASALAILITVALGPAAEGNAFVVLVGAVAGTAWYAGIGPGIVATLLCALGAAYFLIEPIYSFAIGIDGVARLAVFMIISAGIIALTEITDRARQSEKKQQEWLRVVLSSIGDAVIATDERGMITFMNPVAESLTGWKEREGCGRALEGVFRVVDSRTREPLDNPTAKVIRDGVLVGLSNHTGLISRNGKQTPVDDCAAPIRDRNGKLIGAVMVFRDVSERRRAEEARSHLAAIVDSSDDAIISKLLDGTVVSWNRAAERLYGYTAEEMISKPISTIASAGRPDEIPAILERLSRGERVENYETVRRRKDGTEIDVSVTISPIRDGEGHIVGASAVARDIGLSKRREEEHARLLARERAARSEAETSQERIRNLLESISDGFAAFDRHWRFTYLNRKAWGLIRRPAQELLGKSVWEVFPEEVGGKFYTEVRRAAAEGVSVHFETYHEPFDCWFEIDAYPTAEGLSIFGRDITARKRAEEQVQATLREKEVLLREVHHRVKNNLQIISSLLNLQAGFIKDAQVRQIYRESQNRVRSMALIHGTLYQSKNLSEIDFAQYVRRLANDLLHSYREIAQSVRLDIEAEPVRFSMETAIPCGLIINELVSNSLRHAFPEGRRGEIRIELRANQDRGYTLTVRDNGVGLPPGVDIRSAESLGLQLVATLAEQLDGSIELHRNDGTSFEMKFAKLEYSERL